eukprot:TRINITY_DN2451_c0_g1_i5.p1 TRINITY_DN2451_c0_g1~~TRINITY_DN2451_c0_g1_i5.p1  ORF type:complete len:214 (+),score=32.10 TRINITY_DN2451_c0_g1_i5:57-698(+)
MSSTTVIVGTNKALWKSYTRLTESPKAEEIRPRSILQHAFEELSKCIGEKTYAWISDQLRSMRQDLMVQGIRDDLTVRVYELHLELALQNNDLHSFHTCHAQLEDIYSVGLKGRLFHDVFCMSLIKKSIGGHQFLFRKHIKRFEMSIRENPLVISTATMLDLFSQKAWSKAFHMALKLPESWSSFLGPFLDQQRKLAITSFIIGFVTITGFVR